MSANVGSEDSVSLAEADGANEAKQANEGKAAARPARDRGPDAVPAESDRPVPRRSFYQRYMQWILGGGSVVIFFAGWQWMHGSGLINPIFISSPTKIVAAFGEMAESGTLWTDILVSGREFLVGYLLAVAVGIPVGVAVGWYRAANAVMAPFITALYATPRIAMMPLIIVWLGIGLWSKVAIVFFGAVFPLIINMQTAMRTIDADLLKAGRSFGASQWAVFRTIALPSSVPFLISGLRLALGHALIGVVVGEMFAATAGIGYRIQIAGSTFRTDQVFVNVFLLIFAALILNTLFLVFERRAQKWRPNS